ncbi:MAG: hypothetical protein KUL74_09910 [Cloacibacterium sp.]|nr:hypothetical protein [Cloacibacterium sp.]
MKNLQKMSASLFAFLVSFLAFAQEKAVEVTTSTTTTEEWYTNPLYWVIGAVALIAIIAIVSRSGNKD